MRGQSAYSSFTKQNEFINKIRIVLTLKRVKMAKSVRLFELHKQNEFINKIRIVLTLKQVKMAKSVRLFELLKTK